MTPREAFRCPVWGSLILVCAGAALADPSLDSTPPIKTVSLEPTPLDKTVECMAAETCIDQYLWSLYNRAPKIDSVKVVETRRVTVKRKGKIRTVTQTFTRLADEDFTWKDLKAAQRAGLSPMEYVIGGMDSTFKLTLYRALHALDEAGLAPGITSAFRDDYRQSIASGKKAQDNRSYHGGSLRGGYGHGLAADIVSVKGATRAERLKSSEQMWTWIDAHATELGIARPYGDRDPPHVAPIDGKEYADHHGATTNRVAAKDTKPQRQARHVARRSGRATLVASSNGKPPPGKPRGHFSLAMSASARKHQTRHTTAAVKRTVAKVRTSRS